MGTATWDPAILARRQAARTHTRQLSRSRALQRAKIDAGADPAAEKQAAKRAAEAEKSFDWLADDYDSKQLARLSISSQRTYRRQLKRMKLQFRGRTAASIRAEDVVALVGRYKKRVA